MDAERATHGRESHGRLAAELPERVGIDRHAGLDTIDGPGRRTARIVQRDILMPHESNYGLDGDLNDTRNPAVG